MSPVSLIFLKSVFKTTDALKRTDLVSCRINVKVSIWNISHRFMYEHLPISPLFGEDLEPVGGEVWMAQTTEVVGLRMITSSSFTWPLCLLFGRNVMKKPNLEFSKMDAVIKLYPLTNRPSFLKSHLSVIWIKGFKRN